VAGRVGFLLAVAGACVVAGLCVCAAAGRAHAPAAASPKLTLAAGSSQPGWIALAVNGAPGGPVEIRERVGGRERVVARIDMTGGPGSLARAVAWTCQRRERVLAASRTLPDGSVERATAQITTPSCDRRLGLIVTPARLRPGQSARVRVTDTWGQGDVSARVCARDGAFSAGCRTVRLARGEVRARTNLRLTRTGGWTVTQRATFTATVRRRRVEVRPGARYRVLVTGDSMVYGIIDVLARSVRETGGTLQGDPHPGTGITKPSMLNWPQHAEQSVREDRPDASVVFLGAAVDTFPLVVEGGRKAACCGPDWVAEYTRRLREMMASYLRDGNALVFWVLLPAPRDPGRVESTHAINHAILAAAAAFPDGIRVVDIAPVISPGDVYRDKAIYRGQLKLIREPDGIHLANAGVHLATDVILRAMRRDGVATP
jgi:hypothetical protein